VSEVLLLSDSAVATVRVKESGEPLADLRTVKALRVDSRLADSDGAYARVRIDVMDRLVTAQTLLPASLRLLVIEGYRPLDLQVRIFTEHLDRLRTNWPTADEAVLYRMASRYVAPPAVAPHVAGAAVDLTLCGVDGSELWMGTDVNDTDLPACHTAGEVDTDVRKRRDTLSAALTAAGLVNYPTEWWHWSYGDRYWARMTGADHALYGPVDDMDRPWDAPAG
jgi:D-alanyl-D-alanine dipeptidase